MSQPDPALGVLLHAVGGLASASFYLPYRRVIGLIILVSSTVIVGYGNHLAKP